MNKKLQVAKYIIADSLTAASSWILFNIFFATSAHPEISDDHLLEFSSVLSTRLILYLSGWMILYYLTGYYNNIFRKSRLLELSQTAITSLTGVTLLFFLFLMNDFYPSAENYYQLFFSLLLLHFGLTYSLRLAITNKVIHRIHARKLGFRTLIIGGDKKAVEIYRELSSQIRPAGFQFIGFLCVDEKEQAPMEAFLPCLGSIKDLSTIARQYNPEEVIITTDSSQHKLLSEILISLQNRNINIWGIPDLFDLLSENKKTDIIYGSPLFQISNGIIPVWQANLKRLTDVIISIIALIVFSPLFLTIAILIKTGSQGPVLYSQTRIGLFGKPFTIYKFRTMVCHAEPNGPMLSSANDPRVTRLGRFLRNTHLDEIPQFYNVIIGDMSLVGPRPERKYFLDQLIKQAPQFSMLQKIRPGITSWGQVKYGYASSLEEMIERLPYDLIYLKNISPYLDFKILIYSILEIFRKKKK